MTLDPEEKKLIERCCKMLKARLKDLKRLVIHLAPNDKEKDSIEYEYHGKIKV